MARTLKELIAPTVFIVIRLNLILFAKRLMLAEYPIAHAGFLVATTVALIVEMPIMHCFDCAPLA
jgi:hypothetical protein